VSGLAVKGLKEFISTDQAIVNGGIHTIAHGLGVVPKLVQVYMRCKVAHYNHEIGDVVLANHTVLPWYGNGHFGSTIETNSTNVVMTTATSGLLVGNLATGGIAAATAANWDFFIKAFA